jgi:energy-coupling factor transporter ATP-binding protein EcfA2
MSDVSTFRWVEIEAFRGFNERQRIDLDGSAIVVLGPNGTGKTSMFDAMQWLLLGSLERLERFRVHKNDEHIVNRYRGSDPAVVEAELDIRGKRVTLRRQGRHNEGLLEWHDDSESVHGQEAENRLAQALSSRPGQDVRQFLMSSALLQQDVVREVLEDKPSERYQHLAALLGLDQLGVFEAEVKRRADRMSEAGKAARTALQAAQDQVEALRARITGLEANMRMAEDVRAASSGINARLKRLAHVVRLEPMPGTSAEAAIAQNSAEIVGSQLAALANRKRDLDQQKQSLDVPERADLDRLAGAVLASEKSVAIAEEAANEAQHKLSLATERASQMTALALDAIKLLGPTCPVCGQEIEEHDVEHRLRERIESSESDELSRAVDEAEQARRRRDAARAELTHRQRELAPMSAAQQRADALAMEETEWARQAATFELPEGSSLQLVELHAIHSGDIAAFDRTVEALRLVWTATGDLVAALRSDGVDVQLTTRRAELRRGEETVAALSEAARLASKQEEDSKLLDRAATRAVTGVTQRRFKRLQPTVQDIYWRLDPHPSFTTFDFELDVYRARGIATPVVRDVDGSAAGDPLLLFSSSQANVVALSYFLALGWAAGPDSIPFVLLDDPLQSMDDVNALGFADLCRHIRRQRQLVVSTHEHRLGALLQRKLAPRLQGEKTRVIEFKAWTREGPVIDQTVVSPQVKEGAFRSLVAVDAA